MAFLFEMFGSRPIPPKRVPTDTVIPMFESDNQTAYRSISLETTMQFEVVLDANKLHDALWRLLERPGWRKLGARLRMNSKGKLEYHVPAQYTQDRPPVNFSHTHEPVPMNQHPINARLPQPTGKLEVFGESGSFRVLKPEQSDTTSLEHWTHSDKSGLGLHISTFEDSTLVTIVWLHTLMDALGLRELLRAWQAVLDGKDGALPDFYGYDYDHLAELGKPREAKTSKHTELEEENHVPNEEEYILGGKMLRSLGFARFILAYLWELLRYPVEEGRMLFIPSSYFSRLKDSAFADLKTLPKHEITYNTNSPSEPFLSDGDILTAWVMRLVVSTNPRIIGSHPTRTLALMNVFGMRDLLRNTAPCLLPQEGAYVHNCITAIWSHFTVQEFLEMPLGHVAARIRSDLVKQSTRVQIEAEQRVQKQNNGTALLGTGDMALFTMSNWDKARLYDTDFSAAVKGGGGKGGKPKYLHVYATSAGGIMIRGCANIVGKDGQGNWWVSSMFRKESVGEFVRAVESMA